MKYLLILILLITLIPAIGQQKKKWQISVQLQPELTLHQNQYSYRWREKYTKASFNIGFSTALQYNISERLFADIGLGYISRRLNTAAFLNQAKLPLPYYSDTKELNTTNHLSYRTVQVPVNVGYYVVKNEKLSGFLIAGITANYLLNAKYDVTFAKYNATYTKGYLQGISLNGGAGADIPISKKIVLTNSITYSFMNKVEKDKFLFSQDEDVISLTHNFLRVSTGIKWSL